MARNTVLTFVLMAAAIASTGCATRTGEGALIGGASGAALGAGIGSLSHNRAGEGALLGGIIGAVGGGLVGNEMDRQEQESRYYDYGDAGPRYAYRDYDRRYDRGYDVDVEYHYERTHYRPRYRRYYRPSYHHHHHYYDDCRPRRYRGRWH